MIRDAIILIGDRDAQVSARLSDLLRQNGYSVQVVSSGCEALDLIDSQSASLLLLATRPQDMSELEFSRRVRSSRKGRTLPLLLVTRTTEEQAQSFRFGASDYIPEPLSAPEVLARVSGQLALSRLRGGVLLSDDPVNPELATQEADAETRTRAAMQAGRMYEFVWNVETDEVRRSDYSRALGLSGDTGANFFRMVHPKDAGRLEQIFAVLNPTFDAYNAQYRLQSDKGETVFVRESGRGYFDANGRLAHVKGIVVDVTDHAATQAEMDCSPAGLLRLIDRLPIAVALFNADGGVEYINDRFRKIFGYRFEELTEPGSWWRLVCPNEQYRHEVIASWSGAIDAAALHGEQVPALRYQMIDKGGIEHLVEVFTAALGKYKLTLFEDITERTRAEVSLRESEERFRGMADTAPVMLWVSGPDKLCTFFNKGWLAFTGRTMEQELGNGWAQGVHADDLERCGVIYAAAFDARENFQMEYRLRRADGEYRWLLDSGSPRFSADGTFVGYIGSAIDITESKSNQERLLVTQKLESVGLLAGGVVHDINNFLGCILANTDKSLSELGTHSRTRRSLQQIETIAHRALEIAQQVMLYTGQPAQQIETVDVAHLIREMLQLLRVCIPREAELKVHLPASLLLAGANASQLRQVVMNLLINAGEAIGAEKGEINITVSQHRAVQSPHEAGAPAACNSDFICIEVTDTGKGMTENVRKHIFEPFFTTKVAGRGLGLAAALEIVRSHGGTIDVSSAPGQGTKFQVLLPSRDVPLAVTQAPEVLTSTTCPRRGSILIVEDEETLRVSVATMLRKRGFSVLEASDGNFAVDMIREKTEEIAVVLLDLTLPGKSSQEVFQELRLHRPGVKVILTSAYGWENIVGPLKALRSEDFIRKPYQLHELVTAVSQVLPSDRLVAGRARQS
jgi:PAS domain S-box-containing protein